MKINNDGTLEISENEHVRLIFRKLEDGRIEMLVDPEPQTDGDPIRRVLGILAETRVKTGEGR